LIFDFFYGAPHAPSVALWPCTFLVHVYSTFHYFFDLWVDLGWLSCCAHVRPAAGHSARQARARNAQTHPRWAKKKTGGMKRIELGKE
jgi:hypothetical protein